jgi:hypothetical protein
MTLVVNKITEPGGIKSVRLELETVKVCLHGGKEITYSKTSEYSPNYRRQEVGHDQPKA